nr:PREDICTED: lipopolysaccharide-induced tumor necrosis factor-alpha factor homolog [Lepisosteus oculatus]
MQIAGKGEGEKTPSVVRSIPEFTPHFDCVGVGAVILLHCHPPCPEKRMSDQKSTGDGLRDPPPYAIQMDGKGKLDDGGVKVYHLHSPVSPPPPREQSYVQTKSSSPVYTYASEPKQKFVSYEEKEIGREPVMATCTHCQQQVLTNVHYKVGAYAILMCLLFIVCGLVVGCCLIPFFVKHFKDVYHTCPRCSRILHVNKKACCK